MKTGIYIHWPECRYKCDYCDFASFQDIGIARADLIKAMTQEIEFYGRQNKQEISTIFFGGGTPTLMTHDELNHILQCLLDNFNVAKNAEITIEANPDDVNLEKISSLKSLNVNRISLGVQSFLENELQILSRKHTQRQILDAIALIKENFENYSIDVIYALPSQIINDIEKNLDFISTINPPHLSMYTLMIKPNTPFFERYKKKIITDFEEEAFVFVSKNMTQMGYGQYEISSFSKDTTFECQHNKIYWEYQDYIPIGPSSHGKINGNRVINYALPKKWTEEVMKNNHGSQINQKIGKKDAILEVLLMGLRLKNGISIEQTNIDLSIDLLHEIGISRMQKENLIEIKDGFLQTTLQGFAFVDYVVRNII